MQIVEKECRESWAWFLNHLKLDLEIDDGANWTFMSDKQKGLKEAFNEVLPFVAHRFCVRHLHNNFKRAGFSGNTLINALWKVASATIVKWFDKCMLEMIDLDLAAASWLRDKSPSEWSRSHFSEIMILEARDKPIITLLEKIRYLLMTRMQANRDKSAMWSSDDICPRIKDVLHKSQVAAAEYIPRNIDSQNVTQQFRESSSSCPPTKLPFGAGYGTVCSVADFCCSLVAVFYNLMLFSTVSLM
ncbi:uncharacterized protein LOC142165835 [Nicotiana tabacum]|uniref:Uncharacterized protein LOC142165835 n=1 Tax=Nicotiana tabacum TaxID=4097 RepID=A0AC58S5S4_TOBAC